MKQMRNARGVTLILLFQLVARSKDSAAKEAQSRARPIPQQIRAATIVRFFSNLPRVVRCKAARPRRRKGLLLKQHERRCTLTQPARARLSRQATSPARDEHHDKRRRPRATSIM